MKEARHKGHILDDSTYNKYLEFQIHGNRKKISRIKDEQD